MNVAWFGTGLLGAAFVRHLIELGHSVAVWNRSLDKARALAADGARVCERPEDALRGAEQLHLTLADDASVDAVLEPLADAIDPTTWIVDHTTTAPTPTAERTRRWDTRGRRYVHAPVFMGPPQAREGSGVILVCGDPARHEALQPSLAPLTGHVVYVGPGPERAAAFKLFGNLAFIGITGVLGDVNRLARALGVSTVEAMGLFQQFNPGQFLPARAAKIATGEFAPPFFEVTMARKDLRLMLEEAQARGVELPVTRGIAAVHDEAIARGDGGLDSSAIARVVSGR
ncbi:MAG: NAD(P)-dependent oxidoreductase [Vicinamibacteria bacterium]|nr:NAD(P)-dependent oxidoreductase [Vicinamibacteria bacterium]